MTYVKEYWNEKEKRSEAAKQHIREMDAHYSEMTKESVENTTMYDENFSLRMKDNIQVVDMDSVSAIFEYGDEDSKTAVLNFSSYKNPGGMFINGSSAQEESLCHESNLYNILFQFKEQFYKRNNEAKNRALYFNRALYTPNVLFKREDKISYCDVITCAAPNKSAAQKYCNVSEIENYQALRERIRYVLLIAAEQKVDTLILGAYGCGVFGQSAEEVANIFKEYLRYFGFRFKKVVFAIPKHKNGNYNKFKSVFESNNR